MLSGKKSGMVGRRVREVNRRLIIYVLADLCSDFGFFTLRWNAIGSLKLEMKLGFKGISGCCAENVLWELRVESGRLTMAVI